MPCPPLPTLPLLWTHNQISIILNVFSPMSPLLTNRPCLVFVWPGARRADIYLIPPVCILSKLGQSWREGQQTIILFGHNVDCDASASGELRDRNKRQVFDQCFKVSNSLVSLGEISRAFIKNKFFLV